MSTEVDIKYVGDEKKNEMRDSFHICLIFLLAGYLLPCLDFCDNGVLRSDKAKIRQISPSSLFFDVSICTLSRQRYPIQNSKKIQVLFLLKLSAPLEGKQTF